jgi:hypothetical protein
MMLNVCQRELADLMTCSVLMDSVQDALAALNGLIRLGFLLMAIEQSKKLALAKGASMEVP